ncbi:DinI family protein [Candidatus Symbiopectobacterium sp. NZEC135]|uniref:DinI family protein n=1 Tax=Candidatus Symbiopectobacterium sp. NZEC135 TaxID=2820471 RepID=UPI0022272978|nr:DinI family protein [Candidatus Symbiopectobacterium sp. NZEC135]MCW2477620.1 DinI family protein [Candidatus Symbiopectobacterium sp. NZEC135]
MFIELVYDKRNVTGLSNAHALIEKELAKRIHRIFPDADVRTKAMQANAINSDASKSDKAIINRLIEEMFNDADEWLVAE